MIMENLYKQKRVETLMWLGQCIIACPCILYNILLDSTDIYNTINV